MRSSIQRMLPILHHTKKFDGGLHYRFPAQIVVQSAETMVIYRGPGIEIDSYRGSMIATRHLLLFFHNNRHHNTVISWHEDWAPHMHYVNIATPATWDRETVSAIDLDLDIYRLVADGKVIVDDEDEFEQHIDLYQYPRALIDRCRDELVRIHLAMEQRRGILSDAIFSWRPGEPIDDGLAEAL